MAITSRKQIVGMMVVMNIAMYALVSANATLIPTQCPSLDVCIDIPLVDFQLRTTQVIAPCCNLISGIAAANVELCLCGLLKQSVLGTTLASALGLTSGLPIVGGLIPGLLCPILGLTSSVLNAEILLLVNSCNLDPTKFKCLSY